MVCVFFCRTGIERPLKKQSGGLFLGRGRFHRLPDASRGDVDGRRFDLYIQSSYRTAHRMVCVFFCRTGIEQSNATCRWHVAAEGWTEANLHFRHWRKCKRFPTGHHRSFGVLFFAVREQGCY